MIGILGNRDGSFKQDLFLQVRDDAWLICKQDKNLKWNIGPWRAENRRNVFFLRYSFFGLPPMVYLKNIRVFFRLPRFVVHVLFDEERQGGTACCTR